MKAKNLRGKDATLRAEVQHSAEIARETERFVRRSTLEQAERICRHLAARASDYPQCQPGYEIAQAEARGCLSCADAIRAMKERSW